MPSKTAAHDTKPTSVKTSTSGSKHKTSETKHTTSASKHSESKRATGAPKPSESKRTTSTPKPSESKQKTTAPKTSVSKHKTVAPKPKTTKPKPTNGASRLPTSSKGVVKSKNVSTKKPKAANVLKPITPTTKAISHIDMLMAIGVGISPDVNFSERARTAFDGMVACMCSTIASKVPLIIANMRRNRSDQIAITPSVVDTAVGFIAPNLYKSYLDEAEKIPAATTTNSDPHVEMESDGDTVDEDASDDGMSGDDAAVDDAGDDDDDDVVDDDSVVDDDEEEGDDIVDGEDVDDDGYDIEKDIAAHQK